jgi:hypothetical protein
VWASRWENSSFFSLARTWGVLGQIKKKSCFVGLFAGYHFFFQKNSRKLVCFCLAKKKINKQKN